MRRVTLLLLILSAAPGFGQGFESYIANMNDALQPYGTIAGDNCHELQISLTGPWGYRAIPEGVDQTTPDELTWAILRVNSLHVFLDLANLDDKVGNNAIFTLENLRHHQKGTKYVPDSPSVFFSATGPHGFMVQKVDLKKIESIPDGTFTNEREMGAYTVERHGATILLVDQQHADQFQKALRSGILSCKDKVDGHQSGGTN